MSLQQAITTIKLKMVQYLAKFVNISYSVSTLSSFPMASCATMSPMTIAALWKLDSASAKVHMVKWINILLWLLHHPKQQGLMNLLLLRKRSLIMSYKNIQHLKMYEHDCIWCLCKQGYFPSSRAALPRVWCMVRKQLRQLTRSSCWLERSTSCAWDACSCAWCAQPVKQKVVDFQ